MRQVTDKTLDDVCEFIVDCLHATAPTQEEGYPLIRTPNIGRGRLQLEGVYRVSEETYEKWTRRAVPQQGDLILAREAPAGNIAVVTEGQQVCLGQRTVHLRPRPQEVNAQYLCYYLLTPIMQGRLLCGETGATAKHVNMKDIRGLKLEVLPEPQEQERIADILSAYDDLIENNRRRMELLEQSARLLFKEWFVHLRFPGHEHTKIADGVPDGWERCFLPDIIEPRPKEKTPQGDEVRYVPMSALSEAGMTVDVDQEEWREKGTAIRFRNGDTLLARITPCLENGKTAFVNFLADGEVATGSTEFIVLRGKRVSPYFTYCLARMYHFRELAIKSMTGASGRQRVNEECFDDFLVPRPPRIIRLQFDEVAGSVFTQIANLLKQNQQLAQARDILLPRLMNGEVAV